MTVRLSSVPLQHVLFFLPYLSIASVAVFLLATAADNILAALLGTQLISILFLYSNHYFKVYTFQTIVLYMVVFAFVLLYRLVWSGTSISETWRHFRISQLCILYWFPLISQLIYVLLLPSINEILHNQLYVGNLAAASEPALVEELKITHILELHDDSRKNDPSQVKPELLQLCCSDYIGSEKSLVKVAPQALEFMEKVLADPNNRLLVHCAAGGSRSPAMVVLYLVYSKREPSILAAVRVVRRQRPFVDINGDHLDDIKRFLEEKTKKGKA